MDAITLESFKTFCPENVFTFLDMEGHIEKEKKKKQLKDLTAMLNMVQDKDQRKTILKQIEELSNG